MNVRWNSDGSPKYSLTKTEVKLLDDGIAQANQVAQIKGTIGQKAEEAVAALQAMRLLLLASQEAAPGTTERSSFVSGDTQRSSEPEKHLFAGLEEAT